eukprot:jgi/Botrbrau1/7999/Bobra.384_2s0025.2
MSTDCCDTLPPHWMGTCSAEGEQAADLASWRSYSLRWAQLEALQEAGLTEDMIPWPPQEQGHLQGYCAALIAEQHMQSSNTHGSGKLTQSEAMAGPHASPGATGTQSQGPEGTPRSRSGDYSQASGGRGLGREGSHTDGCRAPRGPYGSKASPTGGTENGTGSSPAWSSPGAPPIQTRQEAIGGAHESESRRNEGAVERWRAAYKELCLRWHPDKFEHRYGRLLDPQTKHGILARVSEVFVSIRQEWDELRSRAGA